MTIDERKEILLGISLGWKSISDFSDFPEVKDESFLTELAALKCDLSLLPATLQIENPPSQLKDKVARKLYRIKDEIKTKIKKAAPVELPSTVEMQDESPLVKEEKVDDILTSNAAEEEIIEATQSNIEVASESNETNDEFEEVETLDNVSSNLENEIEKIINKSKSKTPKEKSSINTADTGIKIDEDISGKDLNIVKDETQHISYKPETHRNAFTENEPKQKSYLFPILTFILFFIVAVGLVLMYFKFSSQVDNYQMQVDHLNQQISTLSAQFEGNSSLQSILDSKELKIVNMLRSDKLDNGFAKIFLDLSQGKGVLQLSELPALDTGKAYHLWGNVGADYYSLKVFTSSQRIDFKNFTFSDFLVQSGSKFLLIEDPDDKTDAPGTKILFEGVIE